MNNQGLTHTIRNIVRTKYFGAAKRSGAREFTVSVRDVMNDLSATGTYKGHTPQVCGALKSKKFAEGNGLEIVEVQGPPSKLSPTVVVRYRVLDSQKLTLPADEDPRQRAERLFLGLRGLLKDEIADFGGAKAFIAWVRSEDEEKS